MPIVTVQIHPRNIELKRKLAEGITKVVADVTGNRTEMIHVIFDEVPKENWSRDATLNADR